MKFHSPESDLTSCLMTLEVFGTMEALPTGRTAMALLGGHGRQRRTCRLLDTGRRKERLIANEVVEFIHRCPLYARSVCLAHTLKSKRHEEKELDLLERSLSQGWDDNAEVAICC